jgi:hypothetical protein
MTYANRAEWRAAYSKARAKAKRANKKLWHAKFVVDPYFRTVFDPDPSAPPIGVPEYDAAKRHYDLCIAEVAKCISEMVA